MAYILAAEEIRLFNLSQRENIIEGLNQPPKLIWRLKPTDLKIQTSSIHITSVYIGGISAQVISYI